MFDPEDCVIPEIWCGDSNAVPKKKGKKYTKVGTRTECLKKGFGAGLYTGKREALPRASLRHIKYIGETHDAAFARVGINTLADLEREARRKTSREVEVLLKRVLAKSDGTLDVRAYNSVLLYLYSHGNSNIPHCKKM